MNYKNIKTSLFLLFTFITIASLGQVTFIINSLPDNTPETDFIYLAGSINGWNPGDGNYKFEKNEDNKWQLELDEQSNGSQIEFKFTRGDWNTVEKGANGEEIADRQFIYGNGETLEFDILNWADQGSGVGETTAADNVHIMDEEFFMPQLNRHRRIWIYLPPNYETSDLNYPVLYMHDGQNLFDQYTSFSGEWEVDESLNDLYGLGYQVPIVIGIDNGGAERINELTPWENTQYGGGDGDLYIDFIIETLKPYVDDNYRTKSEQEFTGIMGSSLGGLISHYGALKHQNIFGKAGIFSPSYWFSDSVWIFTNELEKEESMKLYQMAGGQESTSMVPKMQEMDEALRSMGFANEELFIKVVPNGQHNEASWRSQFSEAYLWLFSDYVNDIRTLEKNKNLIITPNPVTDVLHLENYTNFSTDSLKIVNSNGKVVYSLSGDFSNRINLSQLTSGSYFIFIKSANTSYSGKFIKI